jgi:hypothetical protein
VNRFFGTPGLLELADGTSSRQGVETPVAAVHWPTYTVYRLHVVLLETVSMDNYLSLSLCRRVPNLLNISVRFYIPQKSHIPHSGVAGSNCTLRFSFLCAVFSVLPSRAIIENPGVLLHHAVPQRSQTERREHVKMEQ